MQTSGWAQFFHHLDRVERPLCALANTLAEIPSVHRIFEFFSKLGDGPAWVVLIVMIGLTTPDAGNLPAVLIGACAFNLGLHYPSDVLIATAISWTVASAASTLVAL